jgi:NADH:ubiquinone oxidoreductase subunit F (NADH-binding)/NADH:ubiquinone oxidoreductase subunit E
MRCFLDTSLQVCYMVYPEPDTGGVPRQVSGWALAWSCDRVGARGANLIFEELKAVQRQFGYLPADQLQALSKRIDVPLYQLHGVASFYPHFHLSPPAQAEVRVCGDMSCHLRGADELQSGLERRFHAESRRKVTIRHTSCLGRCDRAPAVSINDQIFTDVTNDDAEEMIRGVLAGQSLPEESAPTAVAQCASDPYAPGGRYGALRRLAASRDAEGILAALKSAELRGLGGAGFPTEAKWRLVRNEPETEKYIVCNADESEPGTIKDRFILSHLAHLVVEGMIIAGLVTGARKGIIYIRHEYGAQEKILEEEILLCRRDGLLGHNILGSGLEFELEVFVSPGGYICGEESALLEALEGKRAEPRNKPPFPVQQGLWNKPTVINNVETLAQVPQILERGVDWYKSQGLAGTAGLKFVGISGHVRRPGVYELPMGTPVADLIFERAGGVTEGRKLKAFAPSGPSSGYLPASMADVRLDFKSLAAAGSMLGSGAVVVCAEGTCMLDMALNATKFFRNESCGKCVPCRVGSQKMVDMLTGWTQGQSADSDFALLAELSEALALTSICGLGQVVPAPIASVLKHFRDEVEVHVLRHECPSGVCFTRSTTAAPMAASVRNA